jgi:acetyltransferase
MIVIRTLDSKAAWAAIPALADLLVEAVDAGASVSFIAPLDFGDASVYWTSVAAEVADGETILLVAERGGRLLGTVQVQLIAAPNQLHRAEISKLIVALDQRRGGLGRRLMAAAEAAAKEAGRSLLTLDTRAGDRGERLCRATGWTEAGRIPHYIRAATGRFDDAVLFYKDV